jgi:hypothetical protein
MAADTWGGYNIFIIPGISSAVLIIASVAAKDMQVSSFVGGEGWSYQNPCGSRPDSLGGNESEV